MGHSLLEKNSKVNFWLESPIERRKKFLSRLSKLFGTEHHSPTHKQVTFDYDGRKATIPTYSFRHEVMSLLHDPSIMSKQNIVAGYDIFTGLVDGSQFWKPNSNTTSQYIPEPVDPSRKIRDITSSVLFQNSVERFCTRPHHMPVPLIFFYDKANLDRKGGLAVAPLIFTVGFFKSSCRRKSLFWRVLAYVPNLDIGQGRSSSKDPKIKQREHHQVLSLIFSEFQSICEKGGIKTTIGGRTVILKFFIQFVIGDTSGHNDLCLQFQTNAEKPCRTCHCFKSSLSKFDVNSCKPKTLQDVILTRGDTELLRQLSLRSHIVNAFYSLPMSDRERGIFGCTPWETLHVFDQGIFLYVMESFHDIFGEKTAGKSNKEKFNRFFGVISWYLSRQSERDFPRRSTRFPWIEGTRMTATERLGNLVVLVLSFYIRDIKIFLEAIFDNYNDGSRGRVGPSVAGCAEALVGLLTYEKWLKDSNPAGDVLLAEKTVIRTLQKVINRFPRREGTDGWDIPKMHGAFTMGREQLYRHGNADCWNSSHGEHMHQHFFTKLGRQTQRRFASFADQLGERRAEAFACERAVSEMGAKLMNYSSESDDDMTDDESCYSSENECSKSSWCYSDESIPMSNSVIGRGEYIASSDLTNPNKVSFSIRWKDPDKNLIQRNVNNQMLYAVQSYALSKGWSRQITITGYTTIKKRDVTTGKDVTYRCDSNYRGREWYDWGYIYFEDSSKKDGECNIGLLLGFVRFNDPGFPSPEKESLGLGDSQLDKTVYMICRCAKAYHNFDLKFVTEFELLSGRESVYLLPVKSLLGPAAAVPNIYNDYRCHDENEKWLAILPYRKWGRLFSKQISS